MPNLRPMVSILAANRAARLMSQSRIAGVSRRRFVATTVRDGGRKALDMVDRNFTAAAPDRLWVADITYIPTWAGFLYVAVVLDAFQPPHRRLVIVHDTRNSGRIDALNMALAKRRPNDVIHHSDQGSQYTSIGFGLRCREAGVRPSMGSVGDAYDNICRFRLLLGSARSWWARGSAFRTAASVRPASPPSTASIASLNARHSEQRPLEASGSGGRVQELLANVFGQQNQDQVGIQPTQAARRRAGG